MKNDHIDTILAQWRNERPDIDPSPMGVIGRMLRLDKIFITKIQKLHAEYGLNVGEFDLLATLLRSGPSYALTPKQLLATLMLTSGAMTNRIDRLETKKYIQRSADPDDRRGVLVSLTINGRKLIDAAISEHVNKEKQLLDALSKNEQKTLSLLLKKVLLKHETEQD